VQRSGNYWLGNKFANTIVQKFLKMLQKNNERTILYGTGLAAVIYCLGIPVCKHWTCYYTLYMGRIQH